MNQTSRVQGYALAMRLVVRGGLGILAVLSLLAVFAAPAYSAQKYRFTKVADNVEDGFDPFSFECPAINARGDVAFRAGRRTEDRFNTVDGIYRANAADGTLTTIVEDERRFDFIGRNPSMNDLGQVSFAARLDARDRETGSSIEAIMRGSGKRLATIASTSDEFNFFGFDTSINRDGEVAFKAELDPAFNFDEGLFSGQGSEVTTHYLASTSQFVGDDSRPSINSVGDIAFQEQIDFTFDDAIFRGREGDFTTIAPPDPDVSVQEPVLNDGGTTAFERSFFDEANQEFVSEIVTGNGGPLATFVDTRGQFAFFGFRPPSLNNSGDVAFGATLDDSSTSGIFVGPRANADRVIATGDTLDGLPVQNLTFCEEGLSDSGELTFTATFADPAAPFDTRVGVFRATPSR
jgi:hypothetical protein